MLQGLRHPNVLPLHCSFVAESALWLIMPYIGGGNVSQLLRTQVRSRSRPQAAPHYCCKAQDATRRLPQLIWALKLDWPVVFFMRLCRVCTIAVLARWCSMLREEECAGQFAKGMEEDMLITIAKDVLSGLQYLHSQGLAHRDLKARTGATCTCQQWAHARQDGCKFAT